jgi:hypothetical protein
MNQQQFLRECGKSYPEAVAALGYFRQLVRQQCERVVQKRIKDLGKVIGVSPQDLKITEYSDPDWLDSAVADQVSLGLQARRSESLYLYFYLYWLHEPEEGSAPLGVAIDIWINRSKREALDRKLDQHCEAPAFKGEPWNYSAVGNILEFWLDIKESDLPRFGDKLDALCGYTIRFLKSVKGIASYFRA